MRMVVQRVSRASVTVEGKIVSSIGQGYMILVGSEAGDTDSDILYCAEKVKGLRVFEDENGKMNKSIGDAGGEVLLVSQFTLLGDARHGRRPSFIAAEPPDVAAATYEKTVCALREAGLTVKTGVFRAHMEVELVNDGPTTILLDSRRLF